jgi:hypothetical protein
VFNGSTAEELEPAYAVRLREALDNAAYAAISSTSPSVNEAP